MGDIRIGKVSAVHYEEGTIDMVFEDEEDTVRQGIPLFSEEYKMPEVGDLMAVIIQSNSGRSEQGYAIGKPYHEENKPEKEGKKNLYFKRFSDKAYVHYDPDTGVLEIAAPKVVIGTLTGYVKE